MTEDQSVRPWGRYEILSSSPAHQVKNIYVLPGKRLSYQRHKQRAEHWFIVSGHARMIGDWNAKGTSWPTLAVVHAKEHHVLVLIDVLLH